jgi:cytochrome oxidase Cu insertion factor (SCO1/SenC/PrrC family)
MKHILLSLLLIFNLNMFGQLTDGTIAPDFTLTDYYGNSHHLYSYLDSGKTVFVEIFAAHCPSCWNYHQTHRMKNMYNMYGPDGTDEIMVLALEYDQYNDSNAFTGNHQPWVTAGDWLTGTPYPIFNVEAPDRGVFDDYNVHGYPVIYKVCPDKLIERVYPSTTESQLYQKVQTCNALTIGEAENSWLIYFDQSSSRVIVDRFQDINSLSILDLQGRVVKRLNAFPTSEINVEGLEPGVYVFEFKTDRASVVKKLLIQ